jgi:hypothetical protein
MFHVPRFRTPIPMFREHGFYGFDLLLQCAVIDAMIDGSSSQCTRASTRPLVYASCLLQVQNRFPDYLISALVTS